MRVFLVGGSPDARSPVRLAPAPADRVIAADRGAQHARAWGWRVDLLVGDLDSLPTEEARALAAAGTPTIRVPAAKDQTDLELALASAQAEGATEIVICGALGGRTDHLLANVLLLARPDLIGIEACIACGPETIRLLRAPAGPRARPAAMLLRGRPGDLLSLLPLGGDARGITTRGLHYPLRDEALPLGSARGVSNVFSGEQAEVTLRRGTLLIVHTQV